MILNKTMKELKEAIDTNVVVALWGTSVNAFAIVQNTDLKKHGLEMWKVTP